ncbi:MAG: Lrp/AsnC family transcriptional regulator [Candidatus Diapherotrites archaeon]|uniref:Lrp/AsnC family transcriptional regulator n=1 Tax=Candidatus Iainarchaeum sp. TaxID=3101447 RepID=A0A7J4JUD5_9ARCH|nr:Lrp/AsnC family transcriptional regulator [Candidatus Diapherotrites archaeon]HIH21054.1 Lrp/AsnC family transcriptional regulator [Candidatus Diapherotrites archaeon]HIH32637.1 Lrp/AsnC family transcriptional regulator [Candidatus Diapherotrites archaeon]
MSLTLDKIDYLILQKLLDDGRASFSAIARETNLTDVAIKKRVERLKRKGIIQNVAANLNYKILGYENPIFVQLRTEMSKSREIMRKMQELDYVLELQQVLGEYNLLAKVVVPSLETAEGFISRLSNLDGVIDMKTMVVLQEMKKTSALPSQVLQKKL